MGDIGHETDESINDNGPNSLVEIERKSENGNEVTPTDAQELKTQDFREDLDGPSEEEQRRRTLSFVKVSTCYFEYVALITMICFDV